MLTPRRLHFYLEEYLPSQSTTFPRDRLTKTASSPLPLSHDAPARAAITRYPVFRGAGGGGGNLETSNSEAAAVLLKEAGRSSTTWRYECIIMVIRWEAVYSVVSISFHSLTCDMAMYVVVQVFFPFNSHRIGKKERNQPSHPTLLI